MDEEGNQDFQDLDNPAPTESQSTRRPPRRRGTRAQRKPAQTEILTENVRSLTEVVKALVDREARNAQLPPVQQKAVESMPRGRPGRLADHETLCPRVTGGVIGHTEIALGGSSGTKKNRVGCDREAVILGLPDQERSSRR
ncbi:hypothetical protein TIFTF001_021410 [Ficus carica]|uniref:Uncharacterized protein n=1 Tax=Ficus carica TaxID=3494 RepID=A0AA88AKC3_FICCA|nr:hypothetical protein TIFTF001_021410 [Ficus carica]